MTRLCALQLPGQVVIPVDCMVPDMPVHMDEDSAQFHMMGQKLPPGMNPAHYSRAVMSGKDSGAMSQYSHAYAAGYVPSEPVVDLSVPMNAQVDTMGAPFAPRHGQDIFDTWYESKT